MILFLQDPPAIKDVSDPNALSVEEKASIQGSIAMLNAGASETMCHPFYIGEKPKLPIRDKNGGIHPASCNPSFEFTSVKLKKTDLKALLPEFKKLIPFGHASHVGVYLPRRFMLDRDFIDGLQKQLPKCKIYPISREHVLQKTNKQTVKSRDNKTMHAKPPTARVLKQWSLRRLGDRRRYPD